jgi:hypothetical protein
MQAPDGQTVAEFPDRIDARRPIAISPNGHRIVVIDAGSARLASCDACVPAHELLAVAEELTQGQNLTAEERRRYLG